MERQRLGRSLDEARPLAVANLEKRQLRHSLRHPQFANIFENCRSRVTMHRIIVHAWFQR